MFANKESARAAQQKSMISRGGKGTVVCKSEMMGLMSLRLRDPELPAGQFVALTTAWMILTGRSTKKKLLPVVSVGDDVDKLVQKLEKEKHNG